MDERRVEFRSGDVRLVGDLYVPDGPGPHAAVVLTGPFSAVEEQVTGTYARRFARRGVAALAFDHRTWGESGGTPRQHETGEVEYWAGRRPRRHARRDARP